MLGARVDITHQHQFERQFVRRTRQTKPYSGFDVPELSAVIEDSIKQVGLLACRVELAQRTQVGVLLQRDGALFGEIVSYSCRWREIEALKATMVGFVENWVYDNICRLQVPTDDRPNLGCE